jgi:polyisoprenoid-binding protein YceI
MQTAVLESKKYPEIRFRSTNVTPLGGQAWKVTGTLSLHGVSKGVSVESWSDGETYAGSARLKQSDFGTAEWPGVNPKVVQQVQGRQS